LNGDAGRGARTGGPSEHAPRNRDGLLGEREPSGEDDLGERVFGDLPRVGLPRAAPPRPAQAAELAKLRSIPGRGDEGPRPTNWSNAHGGGERQRPARVEGMALPRCAANGDDELWSLPNWDAALGRRVVPEPRPADTTAPLLAIPPEPDPTGPGERPEGVARGDILPPVEATVLPPGNGRLLEVVGDTEPRVPGSRGEYLLSFASVL
jgi:hypothetical protein